MRPAGAVAQARPVPQAIVDGTAQAMRVQTGGLGGAFVWPTMLRQLEKQGAGYRT